MPMRTTTTNHIIQFRADPPTYINLSELCKQWAQCLTLNALTAEDHRLWKQEQSEFGVPTDDNHLEFHGRWHTEWYVRMLSTVTPLRHSRSVTVMIVIGECHYTARPHGAAIIKLQHIMLYHFAVCCSYTLMISLNSLSLTLSDYIASQKQRL